MKRLLTLPFLIVYLTLGHSITEVYPGGLLSYFWPRGKSSFPIYRENISKLLGLKKKDNSSVVKKITLHTSDGLTRPGILTIRPHAKGNVILCHPASYSKEFFIPMEEAIFYDYNCLKFDFRRHGEDSEEQYATLGKDEVHEIDAAVKIIKSEPHIKHLPLYGFGISMGAVSLIEAESQKPAFDGLILQAPFESISRQAARSFRFFKVPPLDMLALSFPSRWYAERMYRIRVHHVKPSRSIKKITTPIFLIHAKDDPTISFKAFKRLKKAGKSVVKTWTPETGLHTALFKTWTQDYIRECRDFLDKISTLEKPKPVKPDQKSLLKSP